MAMHGSLLNIMARCLVWIDEEQLCVGFVKGAAGEVTMEGLEFVPQQSGSPLTVQYLLDQISPRTKEKALQSPRRISVGLSRMREQKLKPNAQSHFNTEHPFSGDIGDASLSSHRSVSPALTGALPLLNKSLSMQCNLLLCWTWEDFKEQRFLSSAGGGPVNPLLQ